METHSRQRRVEGFRLCISATYWPNATGSQLTGQTGKYSPAIVSPRTSLVAQMVKHLPTMLETWVRSLGQEDPLEKEMATHSSTLAWKLQEFPGGAWWATVHRVPRVRHDWATSLSLLSEPIHFHFLQSQSQCPTVQWEMDKDGTEGKPGFAGE